MTIYDSKTYSFQNDEYEWAYITINDLNNNGAGLVSIISSYGNWSFIWNSMGSNIRNFLIQTDHSYLMDKFTYDKPHDSNYFDFDATIIQMKIETIVARKSGHVTKEIAREVFDEIKNLDSDYWAFDNSNADSFATVVLNECHALWKVFDYETMPCVKHYSPSITNFFNKLWPIFIEQIKEELKNK